MEIWNEICFILSENITRGISEDEFEKYMIQALRVLGWKQYTDDFDIRPSFQIGSANRITPDFVMKSQTGQKLFVIEIKQPHLPIANNFKKQLFSYMRQLKLSYGLLIGQYIQIFYDGATIQQDDPILIENIKFEKDSEKGKRFVQLFSKGSFNEHSLEEFAKEFIDKINRKGKVKKLTSKLLSDSFRDTVINLIKQELINEYDRELIESALENVEIDIKRKSDSNVTPQKQDINKILELVSKPQKSFSSVSKSSQRHVHGNYQQTYSGILAEHIMKSHKMHPNDFLKILADKYINDQREREIFLGNYVRLNSKMNYISGLILTLKGKTIFGQSDIRDIIQEEIIPTLSEISSSQLSGVLLTADQHAGANDPDYHKGYPCLEKIDRDRYRFKGFF